MRVLTLNLWNLNEPLSVRMDRLDRFLRKDPLDVLVFQEVSPLPNTGILQIGMLSSTAGMHCSYSQTGTWKGRPEGLAVMTRAVPSAMDVRALTSGTQDMGREILQVTLQTDNNCVHILNTHLAFRPEDEELRTEQAAQVISLVRELVGRDKNAHVVLCGDLNDVPGSRPLGIVENSGLLKSPFSSAVASRYTFAAANPWVETELVPDRRIDHVFVTPHTDVSEARVVLDKPSDLVSDHFGLLVELKL